MLIIHSISSFINLKRYSDALSFISKVKQIIPHFRDLYFLEFWILYYSNHFKEALIKLDEYINLSYSNSPIFEVKRFNNIYDLNDLRTKILSIIYNN